MLNTYERLLKENPGGPRLRIEHFQVVTPEDIDQALGSASSPMRFTRATSDLSMAEDRLG
ncbi:MAG: hypothetical protein ACLTYN_17455 [Dysosmobacter welbionis]